MMQYQTNRFPHLFHKVLGADFLHTTFYWPSRHRVKICKGAYFRNIKLLFLGMLARPVDLTVCVSVCHKRLFHQTVSERDILTCKVLRN